MQGALRRMMAVPSGPAEWAEVVTSAMAIGWAWAFWHADRFGPPGTTVAHIATAFGYQLPAIWATATAIMPLVSIAIGGMTVRFVSTMACGMTWTMILAVSWGHGTIISPAVVTSVMCLAALFRTQAPIVWQWLDGRGRSAGMA